MSSNFPGGGGLDYMAARGGDGGGGIFSTRRTTSVMSGNNLQLSYRSAAIVQDPLPPVDHRRTDLIGKRSFAELQHHQLLYLQQQFQRNLNYQVSSKDVEAQMNNVIVWLI